jgi:hypothetical protein
MDRKGILAALRDWWRRKKKEHPFWNEPATANKAGDAPLITSHGKGPSHAH